MEDDDDTSNDLLSSTGEIAVADTYCSYRQVFQVRIGHTKVLTLFNNTLLTG
jgi:hypothetical protein